VGGDIPAGFAPEPLLEPHAKTLDTFLQHLHISDAHEPVPVACTQKLQAQVSVDNDHDSR
jgi:hypothetical protein